MATTRRIINTPRLSVNKLAEYTTSAGALRRKRILKDAKYPQTYITTLYERSRAALKTYFRQGFDLNILEEAIEELEDTIASSNNDANDIKNSIKALKIAQTIDLPELEGYDLSPFPKANSKIVLNGVTISVYPDLIIRGVKKGKKFVGGIKFHIVKGTTASEEAGEMVATLVKVFLEDHVAESDEVVLPSKCFAIDIFAKQVKVAPRAHVQRMNQVLAVCDEIVVLWPTI